MSESEVSGSDIYLQPSVRFERGRRYMVCARSGHGKTSLLNFIYGSSLDYDGTISLHEPQPDPLELRRRKISYLFQDLRLFPQLTALENIQIKNTLTGFKSDSEIADMLARVLPADKAHQPVATLSLGQRQRVAAVRALCQPFEFLLMDEPFSHIDLESAHHLAALVDEEVSAQGAALIVTALDPITLFHFDQTLHL